MAIKSGWGDVDGGMRRGSGDVLVSGHTRAAPAFKKGGKVKKHYDRMAPQKDTDGDGMAKGGKAKPKASGKKTAAKQAAGALTKIANSVAAAQVPGAAMGAPPMMKKGGKVKSSGGKC